MMSPNDTPMALDADEYMEPAELAPDTPDKGIVPRLTPRRVRSFRVDTDVTMSTDSSKNVTVLEGVS